MMQRNMEATVLIVAMVLWGANSDRRSERLWHTILLFGLAALGWTVVVLSAILNIRLAGLILVSVGAFTGMALFWAFCTPLLRLEQRPASIALISTAGILGSATSPTIVGFLRDLTHSFNSGLWYAVGLLALGINHHPDREPHRSETRKCALTG
jgi:ACS family 4-hydroxyphenylacetate permease-like MFS transporter